uniref:Uncharacterized protein n=1 Tax=Caenorhabditis japonica TaxID=281687 RepID=A0A8R1IQ72_CAEJA
MSKLMDIRVKQAGIKIICHIFTVISPEQSMKLIEEMKDERKWPMKVFGIDSEHFEPLRGGEPKRSNYFNIFCSSLQKEEDPLRIWMRG